MGMDGLSMANTGMLREATSRDLANKTEENIQRVSENKQVDQLQTQMRVKEDGHNKQDQSKEKEDEKEDEASYFEKAEDSISTNSTSSLALTEEELENNSFYVKITKDGEIFELYDKTNNRLIEKISAEEINDLISKLNMASGILVNRTV